MTRRAEIDPRLGAKILGRRELRYDTTAESHEDRPAHVRAASGLAMHHGRLVVIQDDASFFGIVTRDGVSAQRLPRGLHGRRRFEIALGNKLDKLDLESCVAIDDELWAFGSGSLPIREKICRVHHGVVRVLDAAPLYARFREATNGVLNIEGAARIRDLTRDELWLFHRGNTGPNDPGPAILRVATTDVRAWLDATAPLPSILDIDGYDLGSIDGHRLGFTDAISVEQLPSSGGCVIYLATAEVSPDAIADGRVVGSQIGVIDAKAARATPLVSETGEPLKAEGIALDPARPNCVWVVLDPDDPEHPAVLLDVELTGPW